MSDYREQERKRQSELAKKTDIFEHSDTGAIYRKIGRDFILKSNEKNLYKEIRENVMQYFKDFGISWWGGQIPSGHLLSSQIACLNHLFLLKNDPEMVLDILKNICDEFKEVLPIQCDNKTKKEELREPGYVAFEVVSDMDHLNEEQPKRGSNCTSIDALILAKHKSDKTFLILIEWKYTESYASFDKSLEDSKDMEKGNQGKGKERLRRYSTLINDSKYLVTKDGYRSSLYFQEPFYQLMRQTLWAEQMIVNKNKERIQADDYLHLHVVPSENKDLLSHNYHRFEMEQGMEVAWREMLTEEGNKRYLRTDPQELIQPIKNKYSELYQYLTRRYYNK